MKAYIFLLFCSSGITLFAQGLPGTEIYLFDVTKRNNTLVLSNPTNISNHTGYDNQPFFHPEKSLIYFASENDEGRTDIIEYNYETGKTRKITTTKEREYSPTITPDQKYISCIIQRDSGEQDLGKYPLEGGAPEIIINTLIVGYHAWADRDNIFVFALGDKNTLRHWSVSKKKDRIIQENAGRSIQRIPGSTSVSFVDKSSADGTWTIKKIGASGDNTTVLMPTLPNREDLTWTSDGSVLMTDGEIFYIRHPDKDKEWKTIEANPDVNLKGVTRLSINSSATKLAVVVSE